MKTYFCLALLLMIMPFVVNAQIELRNEEDLIAILNSDASELEKAKACQDLAIVGSGQAVSALASLLADDMLGDYARICLETIEDSKVDEVFRVKLGQLEGRLLVGVINSVGVRRDVKAVSFLKALSKNDSLDVASAALAALGHIATDDAIETIRKALADGPEKIRFTAAHACFDAAEFLLAEDKPREARELYNLVRRSEASRSNRLAATYQLIVSRGATGLPMLIENLHTDESDRVSLALSAVHEIADSEVVRDLGERLPDLSLGTQVKLISVLADCDPEGSLKYIQTLAECSIPEVQEASLKALGGIGDASTVQVLLQVAEGGGANAKTALSSMKRLKGGDIDSLILASMKTAKGELRAKLITVLADRQATIAKPQLLQEATSHDKVIANAAFDALSTLAGPSDLPELVDILVELENDALRNIAETAVTRTATRITDPEQRAEVVVKKSASVRQSAVRSSLIRVLGRIGGDKAYAAVFEASKDSDSAVKDASIRTLASWSDWQAAPELLNLVRNADSEIYSILALRGYVRLLGMAEGYELEDLVKRYDEVLSLTDDSDSKKLILAGLANIAHVDALKLAMKQLDDPSVQAEAAFAAIEIVRSSEGIEPENVRMAMERILTVSENDEITKYAGEILKSITGKSPNRMKKIVLIAGPVGSHESGEHEYDKDLQLLKRCLDNAPNLERIRTELHVQGWPEDPGTLDDADAIVLFSDGADYGLTNHPFLVGDRLEVIERQVARGCGVMFVHYATIVPREHEEKWLRWIGGYFDYESDPAENGWYSKIKWSTTTPTLASPEHPILRGVEAFEINEEFYYKLRFPEDKSRWTPIWTVAMDDEPGPQVVAWAIEREDGRRGFGTTTGHTHTNLQIPSFRKTYLNAIIWTAGLEVPEGGVESSVL